MLSASCSCRLDHGSASQDISFFEISPECRWFTDHGRARLRMEIELLVRFLWRCPLHRGLLPHKIQEQEDIGPFRAVTLELRCHGRERTISRLGRQPRQRRQVRCRRAQRQQQLGRQRERQSRCCLLPAVILPSVKLPHRRELMLSFFRRLDPTTEHPADLVHGGFKHEIFLGINCFGVLHEPYEDA